MNEDIMHLQDRIRELEGKINTNEVTRTAATTGTVSST